MRVLLTPSAVLQARVPRRYLCRPARREVRGQIWTYLRGSNTTSTLELLIFPDFVKARRTFPGGVSQLEWTPRRKEAKAQGAVTHPAPEL